MVAARAMKCPSCGARFEGESAFCAVDGAKLVVLEGADADPLIRQVIAERYRILRMIGEGGMGRVYEAEHVNVNKRLAIKVLRRDVMSDPATVARFRQEARSASSIGHANIIDIDDFATLPDGTVYLAMEMLEGESLGERMEKFPGLTLKESIELLLPVCDALFAAHAKGIVHRDLKPDNIFLAWKAGNVVPKILDFGIAKVSGDEGGQNLTQTGAIFGTPLYMSPEQACGAKLDHRTDVYSMGVILYELLTGQVPFQADSSIQVLNAHITTPPRRPTETAPDRRIPQAMETVVLRALAKEPLQRQSSMHQLAQELRAALVEPAPSPPSTTAGISLPPPPAPPAPPSSPAPSQTAAPSQIALGPETLALLEPTRRSPAVLWIALAGGLALVGLIAFLALRKPSTADPAPASPIAVAPVPVANAIAPSTPVEPPPVPNGEVEVIVSSVPAGAKIMRDGAAIAKTPEAVKLAGGKSMLVVLKKDGFLDQPITIDPSKGRKLLVKLERDPARVAVAKPAPATPPTLAVAPPPPAPPPPAPRPPPRAAPPPVDTLSHAIEKQAAAVAPGARRVGNFYSGTALKQDGRTDWYFPLEMNRCYTFIATAAPGVQELLIYLWGPAGNRVAPRAEGHPNAVIQYCAQTSGMYHFQSKAGHGMGDYKMAIYQR